MKKYKILTLCLTVTLMTTGLWGCRAIEKSPQNAAADISNEELTEEDIKNYQVSTNMSNNTIIGMNQFAQSFYNELEGEGNLFFSPYSIVMAISMIDNGAEGETKKEIETLFGITDLEEWNANLQYLMNSFTDKKAIVNTANSIWWERDDANFQDNIEENFFNPVRFYYNAELFNVDFTLNATVDVVNDWVSEETDEMIPKLLDTLSEETVMLLVNAVYFDGVWKNKFYVEDTFEEEFYGITETSSVDMMHKYGTYFRYIHEGGIQAIELPYGEGNIVMDILLPEEGSSEDIISLYSKLTLDERNNLLNNLSTASETKIHTLSLPKFTMEYKVSDMKKVLNNLGMIESFDSSKANFDLINPSIYISDLVHVAKVEVDENGTRAAAATALTVFGTALVQDEEVINFNVNRPFIYVIRDIESGGILFMGQMTDLSQ